MTRTISKLAIIVPAGCIMLAAGTPAQAQKVYTMPSLSEMMSGTSAQERASSAYQEKAEEARDAIAEQREKFEQKAYEAKIQQQAEDQRDMRREYAEAKKKELKLMEKILKEVRKSNKPKKYKPLKRVRTLPANSTAY